MIFLDSSYLKGLIDVKDTHHQDALIVREIIEDYNEKTVINTTVLVETLNWSVKTNILAKEIYSDLKEDNTLVNLTSDDYLKSLEINCWFGNSINYSDCTIINTMFSMGITRIATFDGDFKKVGAFDIIS
ncbi:type II toxin-antitoxin system VapC family toxin [Methanobrevibacter sp.]|uniref:type II toxin-antitoxin system VapC family toxin n=1 Tax=Methanobrevibacter sp. TaxID=66852 RepID=UPI0026DFD68A|nr:type II toxin-antitoxin system VapC family toxin [Methanobrevibacter sp.]MDO5860794.1 type II toxin-antitoxin system VapC family toxin [Methanobrevibacter sp.]